MTQYVWLISSKDIEELLLDQNAKPRIVNSNNSKKYDVFSSNYGKIGHISLGTFFYDLSLYQQKSKDQIIRRRKSYQNGDKKLNEYYFNEKAITEELHKDVEESSSFKSCCVWKLQDSPENQHVFFTRCFPNKESVVNIENDLAMYKYWLASYIETVCRILENEKNNLDDLKMNLLVHDSDVGREGLIGITSLIDVISEDDRIYDCVTNNYKHLWSKETKIYYYQHSMGSYFYREVITNPSFFDKCPDPYKKLKDYLDLETKSEDFLRLLKEK